MITIDIADLLLVTGGVTAHPVEATYGRAFTRGFVDNLGAGFQAGLATAPFVLMAGMTPANLALAGGIVAASTIGSGLVGGFQGMHTLHKATHPMKLPEGSIVPAMP